MRVRLAPNELAPYGPADLSAAATVDINLSTARTFVLDSADGVDAVLSPSGRGCSLVSVDLTDGGTVSLDASVRINRTLPTSGRYSITIALVRDAYEASVWEEAT